MTLTMREAHRHADRILELVRSGVPEQANDPVAQSWSRCLNEYRLDPAKACEPAFVAHTARFLAALRGVSEAELAATTTANFHALCTKAA